MLSQIAHGLQGRTWTRLVRFRSGGNIFFGEPVLPSSHSGRIHRATCARRIDGDPFSEACLVTEEILHIDRLLCPTPRHSTKTIRCLGLNYHSHAREANMSTPAFPVVFYKPKDALAHPTDPIQIPLVAQSPPTIDFECELVVVIGKRCKNVGKDEALRYVAGYAVGNDLSHREWQLARGGGQWSFSKGFDSCTPFGPGIVRPELFRACNPGIAIGEGKGAKLFTRLNGRIVQEGYTGDMIFGVADAISFLSQGTTLHPMDLIFMGTPAGVGMGRNPPLWLKDGDTVEVGMEGVGTCKNRIHFDAPEDTGHANLRQRLANSVSKAT